MRRKELSLLMIGLSKLEARLTSNGSGPDQGVASPVPSVGFPLLHLLNLNHVARSAARGVRWPADALHGGSCLKLLYAQVPFDNEPKS